MTPKEFTYAFTVFTPTYNRARLLPRVYESLKKQTFRDFEWLIVDDGSSDNTGEIVKQWQAEANFPIRYVAQPNGGKHVATNRGAKEAQGMLFAVLDSDDWYVANTLERFNFHWQQIPADKRNGFVGVCALCSYESGEVLGSKFPEDVFDSDVIDLRYRHKVSGEKNGVLRTDVMRQFPFPEDVGKFINESVVWNRMAKDYKTRFVNEVLTIKEFQEGGLTNIGRSIQVKNTRASLLSCKELIGLGNRLPLVPRVKAYANYVRHSLHQNISFGNQAAEVPSKTMFYCCYFIGVYLQKRDSTLVNREVSKK